MSLNTEVGIAAANATNPDAPEFGKGYKREHNTGCCGICGGTACTTSTTTSTEPEIITRRLTREDF